MGVRAVSRTVDVSRDWWDATIEPEPVRMSKGSAAQRRSRRWRRMRRMVFRMEAEIMAGLAAGEAFQTGTVIQNG